MTRREQIAYVRRIVTLIKGRGARIHTYSVEELKNEVARLLENSYYDGFVLERKTLEEFVRINGTPKMKTRLESR